MPFYMTKFAIFVKTVFAQSVSYLKLLLIGAVRFPDGYCWYFPYSVMELHTVLHSAIRLFPSSPEYTASRQPCQPFAGYPRVRNDGDLQSEGRRIR